METRYFKGPRAFDATGIPLHPDGQSVFWRCIHWNKNDPDTLTNEMTTYDNALTHPWTVNGNMFAAEGRAKPEWFEEVWYRG